MVRLLGLVALLGIAASLSLAQPADRDLVVADGISGSGHHLDCGQADRSAAGECDFRNAGGIETASIDGSDHRIDCDDPDRSGSAECRLRNSGRIIVAGIDAGGDK